MRKHSILLAISFFLSVSSSFAGEHIPGLQGGYQDGFYIKSGDNRFLLKVGTRINFGYTYGWVSPQTDFSSFDLMHAKLYSGGHAFGQTIQYYFQAAAGAHNRLPSYAPTSETQNGGFTLEDYYVRFGHGKYGFKLGQFKVPFSRQAMTYSGNLGLVSRALATRYFALGRDRGLTLHYDQSALGLTLGVFNGGGTPAGSGGLQPALSSTSGQNVSNDTLGGGRGHLLIGRLVIRPNGSVGYSEGDVENREGHRFELGASFAYDFGRDVDLDGDLVVDDTDADLLSVAGEFSWKNEGRSLQGEYFFRTFQNFSLGSIESMGFYVQPAAFLVPERFEVAARFSWLDTNMDTDNNTWMEAAATLNLYPLADHRYKTQLQYTWRREERPTLGINYDHFIDLMFQLSL